MDKITNQQYNKNDMLREKLPYEVLKRILDNAFDEIFVYDNNYRVIYVNRACERHYGMKPSEIIGKTFQELLELECWYPSVLPKVYKEKRRMTIEQRSYLGETIITTAVPSFDENGEIEFVVMSVRDKMHKIAITRKKLEEDLTKNNDNNNNKINERYNHTRFLSEECLDFFTSYNWPGNVRQLENIIERLVVTAAKSTIQTSDLPKIFFRETTFNNDVSLPKSFDLAKEQFEKDIIVKAYKRFKTSTKVVEALNISQSKANRFIRKYCNKK